jgi:hypothetical protein
MWSLLAPCDLARRSIVAGTPVRVLAAIALVIVVAVVGAATGHVGETPRRLILRAAAVAALVVTALGWARADDPASPWRWLGLRAPVRARAVLAGAAVGLALGMHLLVTASRTLGYPVALDPRERVLGDLLYDLLVNVPSAELFLRGALFTRVQRHVSFGTAVAVCTAASLLRYLVDPALPPAAEVVLGAVVYLGLLGAANAWLLWWSGSLVPPVLSSLLFFAAYRVLHVQ